jgi:aminoethylphosphonate catabolism LysR family transcriptional regulator
MRYVQLRAFHHVAVCESFSKAAQMLHLTQPAISDQVRKLEYEYDVRLFDRSKKQIILTQHGHKLVELTHRMFEVEQQVLEYLTAEQSLRSGRLNIIADSTHHILHILDSFREKYPKIQVSIKAGNTASVIESLHSYTSDIGVLGVVPENREFDIAKLSSTPIVAFAPASNEISKLKSIKFGELVKLPLVLREPGSKTRAKLEELAAKRKMKLETFIEAEGREAVREIVAFGGGIGMVSEAEFGQDPSLVKIPISDANLMMDETLITLKERRDSKVIRAFLSLVNTQATS